MRSSQMSSLLSLIIERRAIVTTIFRPASRLALAAVFAGAPLAAVADSPTVVGNVLQQRVMAECPDRSYCEVLLAAVPPGKSLIITDVACEVIFSNLASVTPRMVYLNGVRPNGLIVTRESNPELRFVAVTNTTKIYAMQEKVRHILLTGEAPRLMIGLSSPVRLFRLSCTMTGDLM